ncbi:SusC/RagA family TonB-linked outer membrane protein [Lunatimonas salinarum]|uniref:SusC/RagA family TonB-linked outer membrane protein n=1 Tax=Lunatimonas salinarum TaxID=1774590 RepID=UPI001ADFDC03|nr:TonB-dependent receptor [Lunatimonas salinarum]
MNRRKTMILGKKSVKLFPITSLRTKMLALIILLGLTKATAETSTNLPPDEFLRYEFGINGVPDWEWQAVLPVTVRGEIVDENDMPLPGASIVEKGTSNGTQSDVDGKFSINVSDQNATLVVHYIGFESQEIYVGNRSIFKVVMMENTAGLEEVVVLGYGNRDKSTLAGAVKQISGEILEDRPITNLANGLQGAIAGLTITRNSGQPGQEGYGLNIRGLTSINGGNSPLILIDGVEGDINQINPNDIASISILKDAAASIYGARAAGGVVLITSKSGKNAQALKVTYSNNMSINTPSNLLERLSVKEWVEMEWEASVNANANGTFFYPEIGNNTIQDVHNKIDAGAAPEYLADNVNILNYQNPNWDNLIFGQGLQQLHNISIAGGGESSRYNASFGYVDTKGIFKNAHDNAQRINMRLNYGFDITDRFKVDAIISYSNLKRNSPAIGSGTVLDQLNRIYLWLPERTESGQYLTQWGFQNPRQFLDKEVGLSKSLDEEFRVNITGQYELFDNFYLNGQVATNRATGNSSSFTNIIPLWNYNDTPAGFGINRNSAGRGFWENDYLNTTGYITYSKIFGKHNIDFMAGSSHEQSEFGGFNASVFDFSQTAITTLGLGDPDEARVGENRSHWAIRSLFGRATYIFDGKYIAEFNYRRDGTSVFSPEKRWGDFLGAAFAWRLSEETFINNLGIFDNLKLRFSRGVTGNQNLNTGNLYDYIPLVDIYNLNYPFGAGTSLVQAASERRLVSSQRTWENLETTNFGIDFALFNSKLSGQFDLFTKRNNDMLLGVNLPAVLGGSAPALNIGSLETRGFELTLNYTNTTRSGFTYAITGMLSDAQNTLVDLDGRNAVGLGLNGIREGYPLNTYFGYVYDGVMQNEEELQAYRQLEGVPADLQVGDARYRDLNGDGIISVLDANGDDADIISYGDNAPRYSYGFRTDLSFKGFDFSVFLQGVAERTIFYTDQWRLPFEQPWWQPLRRFYNNTWSPERPDAKYPRVTKGGQRYWNFQTSQNTRINGAYMRVKNITLGYTIPSLASDKIGVDRIRLFFSGEDLFTIDALDGGYDPENTNGSANFYPFTKRYSLGLTVDF